MCYIYFVSDILFFVHSWESFSAYKMIFTSYLQLLVLLWLQVINLASLLFVTSNQTIKLINMYQTELHE